MSGRIGVRKYVYPPNLSECEASTLAILRTDNIVKYVEVRCVKVRD